MLLLKVCEEEKRMGLVVARKENCWKGKTSVVVVSKRKRQPIRVNRRKQNRLENGIRFFCYE